MYLQILLILLLTNLFTPIAVHPLSEFLKPILSKECSHSIKGIDFIYLINLDQRPEKLKKCIDELMPYGIIPCRFSAVNGWQLPLSTISKAGVQLLPGMNPEMWGTYYERDMEPKHEKICQIGRTYFCHCMSRGAIGIVLSHLSLLVDAYQSGYQTVWIMEDDVKVIRDPHVLSDYIKYLDRKVGAKNWDLLFTDNDTHDEKGFSVVNLGYAKRPNFEPVDPKRFTKRTQIKNDITKIGARYGAYSYIIRRTGMQKLIHHLFKYRIFLPFDMEYYLPKDIHLYTITDNVVIHSNGISDNGGPNYLILPTS
ncbi:MAG: hypothetical protein A3F09_03810 [Chlamydiae bacterium RIFCSPHIGHO2_12_FULL_49_11]|nr:MAG: hypothetical protein A3F09_03810 [Chlamydiae bacterium RIFCSPHIGHO2_12_FULL_49_11]